MRSITTAARRATQAVPPGLRSGARSSLSAQGLDVALVFLDIDDFKAFNTKYTETVVNGRVLPPFFRVTDQVACGRGYAVTVATNCVLLFPNATLAIASASWATPSQEVKGR